MISIVLNKINKDSRERGGSMKQRKATLKKAEVQATTNAKHIHKRTPSNASTTQKPTSKK